MVIFRSIDLQYVLLPISTILLLSLCLPVLDTKFGVISILYACRILVFEYYVCLFVARL